MTVSSSRSAKRTNEFAAFFLKKGASVDNVKQGWIQDAKKRNWSELLTLLVDAGVGASEFLDDEQARAACRLPPTPRDKEIQNLLSHVTGQRKVVPSVFPKATERLFVAGHL